MKAAHRLSLLAALAAGVALRLWNLRDQILGGDELHALRAAVARTVPEILTTYALTDSCLPLTALYRWLLDRGVSLSEMTFRMPSLLCGTLALALLPWIFRERVPRPVVHCYAWLLALSPLLVLYSRIARSYLPMLLCGVLAVMAFEAWWRTRAWRWGGAYVLFGALALWLHLGAGPLVAAPFLFAVGDLAVHKEDRWRRLRDLVLLGMGLSLACALFLVPARASLVRLVGKKMVADLPGPEAWWDVLRLQAGTPVAGLAVLFWVAAVVGLLLLLREQPRLGAFTLTVVVGHLAGMLALAPQGMGHPLVLNRYLLPALPFVLLWVACAGGWLWTRRATAAAPLLFLLLVAGTGPFADPVLRRSSFGHHNDFVDFVHPRATVPPGVLSSLYRDLPPGPVLEAPWPFAWDFGRVFYLAQQIHGHRVLVAAPYDLPRRPGIRFRNEIPPDPAAILASPARTVVVHLRLSWEDDRVQTAGMPPSRRMRAKARRAYRRAGEHLAARLAAAWGPPDAADGYVRVWDLERVRRGAS